MKVLYIKLVILVRGFMIKTQNTEFDECIYLSELTSESKQPLERS